jgi:hypothetical protein
MTPPNPDAKPLWFQRPQNFRRVLRGLFAACGCFALLDFIFWLTDRDKHPHFAWEQWPAFYAIYGFVACVVLVLVSRFVLRPLVMRSESYYEERTNGKEGGNDD